MSHTPTVGQNAQVAALQATLASAQATEASALATYNAAKLASKAASVQLNDYLNFINGNKSHYKPNVISGNPDEA